jgi:hypothetical protein
MTARRSVVVVAALALGLSGCAAPSGSPSSALPLSAEPSAAVISPDLSAPPAAPSSLPAAPSSSPAASRPSRSSTPPREPTDKIKKTTWVVGTVTTGGSGPCYSLTTDDGTAYALHNATGTTLVKGARMRVRTEPATVRISCGPGKLVEMTGAELLR